MTKQQIVDLFQPGTVVEVTNHFITREDHPCFGTNERTIAKATGSHLWFTSNGNVPWPKAANLQADMQAEPGIVRFYGYPNSNDLFLTFKLVTWLECFPVGKDGHP